MVATLVASNIFAFADGGAGHVCNLGSAPAVGEWDVLFVNSNTVVSTPAGFTIRPDATDQQGAYIFTRKAAGGESSTVTVTTSGNHNTDVVWHRWSGIDDYSAGGFVRANNTNATVLPSTSTGTLASTGMLLLAFAALHNFDGAAPASPSWGNGFTDAGSTTIGGDGSSSAVAAFVGYKIGVGTASETVDSVSWTNLARNRYALWVAFTAVAGGTEHDADSTLAETGTVAGTAAVDRNASATLTETGTVAGVGAVGRAASLVATGTGQIAATASLTAGASASITGTGTLATTGETVTGAASGLVGVGNLAGVASIVADRNATLAAIGSLVATTGLAVPGTGALAVAGTLGAAASIERAAAATLAGTGSLGAVSGQAHNATATLNGVGALAVQLPVEPGRHRAGTIRPRLTASVGP